MPWNDERPTRGRRIARLSHRGAWTGRGGTAAISAGAGDLRPGLRGFSGDGPKAVIPNRALAKLEFRNRTESDARGRPSTRCVNTWTSTASKTSRFGRLSTVETAEDQWRRQHRHRRAGVGPPRCTAKPMLKPTEEFRRTPGCVARHPAGHSGRSDGRRTTRLFGGMRPTSFGHGRALRQRDQVCSRKSWTASARAPKALELRDVRQAVLPAARQKSGPPCWCLMACRSMSGRRSFVSVLGPSGCGKTTLARMITGCRKHRPTERS